MCFSERGESIFDSSFFYCFRSDKKNEKNPKCFIHLIKAIWDEGIKIKITYHYD